MKLKYYFGKDDEEFEYEVDAAEILEVAINYYSQLYGASVHGARSVLAGLLSDDLLLYEEDEEFIDFLKEHFEADAKESYEDCKEYERDPYSYYGVSRSDFF